MRTSTAAILISGLVVFGAAAPALAADMIVKAPPMVRVADIWSGFYIGANAGYAWSASMATATFTARPSPPGGGLAGLAGAGDPVNFNMSGVTGGFQVGYNWQVGPQWVLGFETDFNLPSLKGSGLSTNLSPVFVPFVSYADQRLQWFGTVRGRVGFLAAPNVMIYGTGGFAYGRVTQDITYNTAAPVANFDGVCPTPGVCYAGSSGRIATGYTFGGGVEYAIARNWTIRGEYLYVNLRGNSLTQTVVGGVTPGFSPSTIDAQYNALAFQTIRAGINYKF